MLKFKYIDGCLVKATSRRSSVKFPASIVQPNDAYTIRQIYECHAPGHWDDLPPTEPYSGIKIYALDR